MSASQSKSRASGRSESSSSDNVIKILLLSISKRFFLHCSSSSVRFSAYDERMSANSLALFPAKLGTPASFPEKERDFFPSNSRKVLAFAPLDISWVTCPGPANHCGLASPLLCPMPTPLPGKISTPPSNRN